MPDSAKADPPLPVRPLVLWLGMLGGPLAWLTQFLLNYILVRWACAAGQTWSLHVAGFSFLLCCLALAFLSWRSFRVISSLANQEDRAVVRGRFMATLGIWLSTLFALITAAQVAAAFLIDPC